MNTYVFDIVFENENAVNDWINANLDMHEDGIRSLYNGEVVWAVETLQNINEKAVTLKSIKTWKKH